MTRMVFTVSTVLLATATGFFSACDQNKSKVEQRASEMVSANSATAKPPVDAAPDPKETEYKERKALVTRTVEECRSDEHKLTMKDPGVAPGILRRCFEDNSLGDKAARELEAKRKKDAADGYVLEHAKVTDITFSGPADNPDKVEVIVVDKLLSRGLSSCFRNTEVWLMKDKRWVFSEKKASVKVDCE